MSVPLDRLLVSPSTSLREVVACIDRNAKGIALIVDDERRLIGTVTDGDVRRAILAGISLDVPVHRLLEQRPSTRYPRPITAPVGASAAELVRLMNEHSIRHIPLLDDHGRVLDVVLLSDLTKEYELGLTAVVMAGGLGTRLRPLTEELPKPMLPLGDRPLLELIIEQLRKAGIHRVNLAARYKAEVIAKHFGDGRDFGVEIHYSQEDQPLGTAGALSLFETSDDPLLVINGDILTRVDFRAMLDHHREHHADMTVGVRQYDLQVPYGVIECEGPQVRGVREKPQLNFLVSAGIYLLEPTAHRRIPAGQRFDMTDLIQLLVKEGLNVVSFPIVEYWLDIGAQTDYSQAQRDAEGGRFEP